MKPLDYGKRRIQYEVRGDFQPQDYDVYQHDGLGYRANFSYTDQYETGLGDIGVSIGYQRQDTSAPEDYYNGNSTFQLCNTSANNPRSEEHTSELQSLMRISYAVFCLKKKT